MKRWSSEWEKIFANKATNKINLQNNWAGQKVLSVFSNLSKLLGQTNTQTAHAIQYQKKQPNKKQVKNLNRHISKETYTWPKKDMKRCSAPLGKCKSKLQWSITSHQSEWPSSENLLILTESVKKRETYTVGKVNWYSHFGELYGGSSKT